MCKLLTWKNYMKRMFDKLVNLAKIMLTYLWTNRSQPSASGRAETFIRFTFTRQTQNMLQCYLNILIEMKTAL